MRPHGRRATIGIDSDGSSSSGRCRGGFSAPLGGLDASGAYTAGGALAIARGDGALGGANPDGALGGANPGGALGGANPGGPGGANAGGLIAGGLIAGGFIA
jgi:hypothetical protein